MPHPGTLHHELLICPSTAPEAERRWIVVLHGIYGHGRNWASVARRVVRERPAWGAVLVDLREHGDSRGFPPPHTLEETARDVRRTVLAGGWDVGCVVGHSFGGKVALEYARLSLADAGDAPRPDQVWVIDASPDTAEPHGGAWAMIGMLRRHPGPFRSREEGLHVLEDEGLATPIARWMAMNLEEEWDGTWRWRIDADVMEALMADYFRRDLWPMVESPPAAFDVHLVRATDSSALVGSALRRVEAAARRCNRVHLHELEGHHWLNADNPDGLVELVKAGLPAP
jgi:pimeloyl-ACP methyl ester carboxylesterase